MIDLEANYLKRNKACVVEMAQWPPKIHALFLWHGIVAKSRCPVGDTVLRAPIPLLHPGD